MKKLVQILKLNKLIEIFKETQNQEISTIKNFYPRLTFPNMQYEESNRYTQAFYTNKTIYE